MSINAPPLSTDVSSPLWRKVIVDVVRRLRGASLPIVTPGVSASPWVYTNGNSYDVELIILSGTIASVVLTRSVAGKAVTMTAYTPNAPVWLSPGDSVTVTYTAIPAVSVIPR